MATMDHLGLQYKLSESYNPKGQSNNPNIFVIA